MALHKLLFAGVAEKGFAYPGGINLADGDLPLEACGGGDTRGLPHETAGGHHPGGAHRKPVRGEAPSRNEQVVDAFDEEASIRDLIRGNRLVIVL